MKQQPKMSPVPLTFEPGMPEPDQARFFGLEDIADPDELLERATGLTEAFRAAAEHAAAYQALAAAELTDPRRFDRLTFAELGERIGLSAAAAQTLAERGQRVGRARPVADRGATQGSAPQKRPRGRGIPRPLD